ncbi:helix-turn-helix domain-containing protein [Streptomyces sp. NPDC057236]|uniref:helix-turn-helix domain-containing protein n=1 Tax=Streptomyces sp. NPDC057236 TaxID=3346059 RepID=UPI003630BBC1
MTSQESTGPAPDRARVIPLRPGPPPDQAAPAPREPLLRDLVGDVLRSERLAQERTLKDVADAARISMPYLSEVERGRKEASSEVLAAAARALGLGLGDLLARAHGELVRATGRRAVTTTRAASGSAHDGLCLAA